MIQIQNVEIEQMTTTYKALHNGEQVNHSVTDTQNSGESDSDFLARHAAHIASDMANGWPLYHP